MIRGGSTLLAALLVGLLPAAPLAAQVLEGDGRVLTIAYREGGSAALRSAIGNSLTIVFAPGERVTGFELGDPGALEVSLSGSADSLFLRALRQPANPALTVHSNLRSYNFTVAIGPPELSNYLVRFDFASASASQPVPDMAPGRYRLSGNRALQPVRISDDGVRTQLEWAPDQLLPAVFALNPLGAEEMVDGYMRSGIFTIDRVNQVLIFRIDRKSAKAQRLVPQAESKHGER